MEVFMKAFLDAQVRMVRTTSHKMNVQEAVGVAGHLVAEKGEALLFFYRDGVERVALTTSPVQKIARQGDRFLIRTKTGTTYVFSRNEKGDVSRA